jgi:hypothetical protein
MNNKGQSVMSEYVLIFFVVIAAVAALTVLVQRTFEGRVHDARNFMIDTLINSNACDANCRQATGGNIYYEYEPYYSLSLSDVQHNLNDTTTSTTGNPQAIGAIYNNELNEATTTVSTSTQAPPCASLNPVPAWCN